MLHREREAVLSGISSRAWRVSPVPWRIIETLSRLFRSVFPRWDSKAQKKKKKSILNSILYIYVLCNCPNSRYNVTKTKQNKQFAIGEEKQFLSTSSSIYIAYSPNNAYSSFTSRIERRNNRQIIRHLFPFSASARRLLSELPLIVSIPVLQATLHPELNIHYSTVSLYHICMYVIRNNAIPLVIKNRKP